MDGPYNCVNLSKDISKNVKQMYNEWYDIISDDEIDNVYILREINEISEGWVICLETHAEDGL